MLTLKQRHGHEENLSKALGNKGAVDGLLKAAGIDRLAAPIYEFRVDHGARGHEGRLDILLSTNAGPAIVEVQYGTSDSNHRNRFKGYAKSVGGNPVAIIWAAEEFRAKDLQAVRFLPFPVIPCLIKWQKGRLHLAPVGNLTELLGSLEERIAVEQMRVRVAAVTQKISSLWLDRKVEANQRRNRRNAGLWAINRSRRDAAAKVAQAQKEIDKARQEADTELGAIKQIAFDAYGDWLMDESEANYEVTRLAYQKAFEACQAKGYVRLFGLPLVEEFLELERWWEHCDFSWSL